MIEKHLFGPFHCALDLSRCKRADLEIYGIDHLRPSYTGLIFINDSKVSAKTASEDRRSYAGRFSVFAHEYCYGDEGHCTPRTRRRFDTRRSHPLTKAFKRVTITEALRSAVAESEKVTVTIIVDDDKKDGKSGKKRKKKSSPSYGRLFSCAGLQIVTFV